MNVSLFFRALVVHSNVRIAIQRIIEADEKDEGLKTTDYKDHISKMQILANHLDYHYSQEDLQHMTNR